MTKFVKVVLADANTVEVKDADHRVFTPFRSATDKMIRARIVGWHQKKRGAEQRLRKELLSVLQECGASDETRALQELPDTMWFAADRFGWVFWLSEPPFGVHVGQSLSGAETPDERNADCVV